MGKEAFQAAARFLAKTYEGGAIFFTTDREKYDFVLKQDVNIAGIEVGEAVPEGGFLDQCIKTGEEVEGRIARSVYGIRLKLNAYPVFSAGNPWEVVGTCGVYVPRLHPAAKAFDVFAPVVAELLPEGVWVGITDLQKIAYRYGTEKFDLKELEVGTPIWEVDLAWAAINEDRKLISEIDAKEHGPVRIIRVPLKDEETGSIVGTFGITYPRNRAKQLQEIATLIKASADEISSIYREAAACLRESRWYEEDLLKSLKEVHGVTGRITELINYLKSIAEQAQLLDSSLQDIKTRIPSIVESSDIRSGLGEVQLSATDKVSASAENLTSLAEKLIKLSESF